MNIDIAIIILNWNKPEITIRAARSIKNVMVSKYKIIIADNGSNDETLNILLNENGIELLTLGDNHGYAEGYNIAVRRTIDKYNPRYLLLLNNDTVLCEKALDYLYNNRLTAEIISPKILYPDANTIWACGGILKHSRALAINRGQGENDIGQYDNQRDIGFASGCAIWIKTEVVAKIGLFDPEYKLYYEDVDFCCRARKNGFRITYVPEAIILHWAGATSGDEYGILQSKYRWRNRILFARKNIGSVNYLAFILLIMPLIIMRDTIRYLFKGRRSELAVAYRGIVGK